MHKKPADKLLSVFAKLMTAGTLAIMVSGNAAARGEKNYDGIDWATEYEHFSPKTLELLKRFDCIDCHRETSRKLGPSYHDIAARYRGKTTYMYHGFNAKSSAIEMPIVEGLVKKIQLGGKGDWYKRTPMPINDEMELHGEEFTQIVKEILAIPVD